MIRRGEGGEEWRGGPLDFAGEFVILGIVQFMRAQRVRLFPTLAEKSANLHMGVPHFLNSPAESFMVARVLFPVLTCRGHAITSQHRATIKALPSLHHPPSPLRILMSFLLG